MQELRVRNFKVKQKSKSKRWWQRNHLNCAGPSRQNTVVSCVRMWDEHEAESLPGAWANGRAVSHIAATLSSHNPNHWRPRPAQAQPGRPTKKLLRCITAQRQRVKEKKEQKHNGRAAPKSKARWPPAMG
jgi:hypothetical protein